MGKCSVKLLLDLEWDYATSSFYPLETVTLRAQSNVEKISGFFVVVFFYFALGAP